MPQRLRIAIASADDADAARRRTLETITALNERLAGRVQLDPVAAPAADADATLALLWNEADDALAQALASAPPSDATIVLLRTDPPRLALTDREAVLRKLAARQRLDRLLERLPKGVRRASYERDPAATVERELARRIEASTGHGALPLDLRPRLDGGYVERPRLLRLLPDAPGHVVVVTAPYGSGKSVLAAQWAARLEADGHRVAWPVVAEEHAAVAPRLAATLGLAPDTPIDWLRERLWDVPTVVVAEGLAPDAQLAPLLDDPRGLVLLASREPLRDPALETLEREGRLTRLAPADLAFTPDEAVRLAGDEATGTRLQAETFGWALPLHVATLTGAEPEPGALLAGVRASLPEAAWRELLLLAAVERLPTAAGSAETDRLVAAGFVQALGNAVRLHPWLADRVREREAEALADAVLERAARLPTILRGEAYATFGLAEQLAGVLAAAAREEAWRVAPTLLVAWDAQVEGFASPERDWAVGAAHGRLGDVDRAIARLVAALDAPSFGPAERLAVARELCVPYGVRDPEAGFALLRSAEAWIPHADAEVAARFLANAALLHAHAGEMADAVASAERAVDLFPADSAHRVATEVNLALFGWNVDGDFDARRAAQLGTLERVSATYPVQALGQCRDLGLFHAWLGDWPTARDFLERAAAGAAINPAIAVEARATLAYLDGDRGSLAEEARLAASFPNPYVADIVAMYRILTDLDIGDVDSARRSYEASPKETFATCGHARTLAASGEAEAALALLDAAASDDRVRRLYLAAARYDVTRDRADLDAFLRVTTAGARLLPGFFALDTIPDEPGLAAHYPIDEVLRSGRVEAIRRRADEIPPLRVDLLGGVEVRLLGEAVALTGRHRQILALLLLGFPRERAAEAIWPESDPRKQRNNLHVQLAGLRKAIEPWGVPTYVGESALHGVDSDYLGVLAAIREGDVSAVLAAYRGPLAPEIDLPPIEEERARLHEAVVATLFDAAEAAATSAGGAPAGVEPEALLRRVLELEPLHEQALQRLLVLLASRGRRREATDRYRRFEARLREELGLEPLPETRQLLDG